MSETERQKVLDGYGTVVVDLESEKTLCKYNMEHYFPPKHAIESFARQISLTLRNFIPMKKTVVNLRNGKNNKTRTKV